MAKRNTNNEGSLGIIYPSEYGLIDMTAEKSRAVDVLHVARLKSAISVRNELEKWRPVFFPIKGGRWGVRDGQHRTMAAMELGIPIPFVVSSSMTLIEVALANALTKKWAPIDYMRLWAPENPSYKAVLDLCMSTTGPGGIGVWIRLCEGKRSVYSHSKKYVYQSGLATFEHVEWAKSVWELAEQLHEANARTPHSVGRFLEALSFVMGADGFSSHQLVDKFRMAGSSIGTRRTRPDMIDMIVDAYNYKRRSNSRIDMQTSASPHRRRSRK